MNLKETYLGDVNKMMIVWSKDKFGRDRAEKHDHSETQAGLSSEPTEVVLTKKTHSKWTQKPNDRCLQCGKEGNRHH